MKNRIGAAGIVCTALFALFAFAPRAGAQGGEGHEGHEMSPEEAAMMQAWHEAMTPGPQHAELAKAPATTR